MAENYETIARSWRKLAKEAIPDITADELRQLNQLIVTYKGAPPEIIVLNTMRSFASYQTRYPAFTYAYDSGAVRDEREYRALEISYTNTIKQYLGDAANAFTSPDKLGQFMLGDTSVNEVRDRLVQAENLLASAPEEYKRALQENYGIDSNYQLAFLLDPATTKPLVDKKANDLLRGVTLATRAAQEGFNLDAGELAKLTSDTQSMYGGDNFASADVDVVTKMKQAAIIARSQDTLAGIEQDTTYKSTEAVSAQYGDVESVLASQKRAERERARFGGTSGVRQGSLNVNRNL